MASVTFTSGTIIPNAWAVDVNSLVWGVFNGATTAALARTALGATATGVSLFTAATALSARTTLSVSSTTEMNTAISSALTVAIATGTHASVFTWNGTGGSTGSLSLVWQKIGNFVTLNIPAAIATTGTSSTSLINVTVLPAGLRPAATQSCVGVNIINSGVGVSSPGFIQISSAGVITIQRDGVAAAFTDATSCGLSSGQTLTYCIV